MSNTQEAINSYIHHINLKIQCLSYGFRNTNWDNLVLGQEETLSQLQDLNNALVESMRFLPEERTVTK